MSGPAVAWLYGDLACPWSWLAHARLRALEDEGALTVGWRPLRRAGSDRGAAEGEGAEAGEAAGGPVGAGLAAVGLRYRPPARPWPSEEALCAVEFARDLGRRRERRALESLFRAGLEQGRDLGSRDALLAACAEAGLDTKALAGALEDGRYLPELEIAAGEADRYGITAVPGILVGSELLIGAAPSDVLARAAARAGAAG